MKRKARENERMRERERERERKRKRGRDFVGPKLAATGNRVEGEDRVTLSSLMNIQFCLVRPSAGLAGVVTPAAGPVTIIAITRRNRCIARLSLHLAQFSPVSLYLWNIIEAA